jgi:hypothetical protein
MFDNLKPLIRIAEALEQIASALCYFAATDARERGSMFTPGKVKTYATDSSELMSTPDPATVARFRQNEADLISNRGYRYLDELEAQDE